MTLRTIAFWVALTVSAILLLAIGALTAWVIYSRGLNASSSLWFAATYGSLLAIFGSVFSSVCFGWRLDRRELRSLRKRVNERDASA